MMYDIENPGFSKFNKLFKLKNIYKMYEYINEKKIKLPLMLIEAFIWN